jgi:hypothetical protein
MNNLKKISALSLAIAGLLGTIQSNAAVTDVAFFRALPMVIVWGADAAAEGAPTANPVASDFVLLGGTAGTAGSDIITGNVFPVITGTLTPAPQNPVATTGSLVAVTNAAALPAGGGVLTDNAAVGVLNAADSMTKFGIQSTTAVGIAANAVKRSFYVASNAGFDIFAQTGAVTTTGDFTTLNASSIGWSMAITVAGTDGGLAFGANAQDPTTGGTGILAGTTLNTFATPTKVFDGGRKTAATTGNLAAQSVRFDVTYALGSGYNFALGAGSIAVPVTFTVFNP